MQEGALYLGKVLCRGVPGTFFLRMFKNIGVPFESYCRKWLIQILQETIYYKTVSFEIPTSARFILHIERAVLNPWSGVGVLMPWFGV